LTLIRVVLLRVIGAFPLAGSSRGCMSIVELTQSGPMQASIPDAVAPRASVSPTASTAALRIRPFNQRPVHGLNNEPWRKVPSLKRAWTFACSRPSGQPALAKLSFFPL
jgi:hypothetical protein